MSIRNFLQKSFRFYADKIYKDTTPVCIMTACSARYFDSLRQCLLPSVLKYEPQSTIVLWNLGLEEKQIEEFKTMIPNGIIKDFPFEDYPSYYQDLASFAWMSACISNNLHDDALPNWQIWLDTRDVLYRPLFATRLLIKMYGFYSPYSRTSIGELTYPTTLALFKSLENSAISWNLEQCQMLNTAVMGFDRNSGDCMKLVWEWLHLSKIRDFIVPVGSNRENHRQDQSLISLIYYKYKKNVPVLATRFYDIKLHQCAVK